MRNLKNPYTRGTKPPYISTSFLLSTLPPKASLPPIFIYFPDKGLFPKCKEKMKKEPNPLIMKLFPPLRLELHFHYLFSRAVIPFPIVNITLFSGKRRT